MASGAPIIRRAEARDDLAVGELLVTAFMTAYAAKMPEVVYGEGRKRDLRDVATKRAEGAVFVAELDGEVVGTVLVYPPGAPRSEAWRPNMADLRQLAVAPACFGRGYSAALLDAAEGLAWSWGVDAIGLHVRRGAHGVASIYRRRGYVPEPSADLELPEVSLEAFVLARR